MSRIFATANRRFFATNIVVSLRGKFAASLPGGKARRQHRPPERPHLERRDPRGRRPAGRGDHVLELPGVLPRRPHHPGRPLHGRRGAETAGTAPSSSSRGNSAPSPKEEKIFRAHSFSSRGIPRAKKRPVLPIPTWAGVFGIARTTRAPSPRADRKVRGGTPAAIAKKSLTSGLPP